MAKKIRIEITAEDRASKDVKKFSKNTERSLRDVERSSVSLNKTLKKSVTAIKAMAVAATAAVAGLTVITKKTLNYADSLAKTADKVGVSTKALQEFRFAAKLAGVQQTALDMGLQRFSRRIAEAAQGQGELVKVLEQYNIQVKNTNGTVRSTEMVMNDLADVIKNAESDTEALRIAFKAFDSEGAALVNMLRGGSVALEAVRQKARDLGIVINDNLIRNAEKTTDNFTILSTILRTKIYESILKLTPAINELVENFIKWYDTNQNIIEQQLEKFIYKMKVAVESLNVALKVFLTVIKAIAIYMAGAFIGAIGRAVAGIGGMLLVARKLLITMPMTRIALLCLEKQLASIAKYIKGLGAAKWGGLLGLALFGGWEVGQYLKKFKVVQAMMVDVITYWHEKYVDFVYSFKEMWVEMKLAVANATFQMKKYWADFINYLDAKLPEFIKNKLGISAVTEPINEAGQRLNKELDKLAAERAKKLKIIRKVNREMIDAIFDPVADAKKQKEKKKTTDDNLGGGGGGGALGGLQGFAESFVGDVRGAYRPQFEPGFGELSQGEHDKALQESLQKNKEWADKMIEQQKQYRLMHDKINEQLILSNKNRFEKAKYFTKKEFDEQHKQLEKWKEDGIITHEEFVDTARQLHEKLTKDLGDITKEQTEEQMKHWKQLGDTITGSISNALVDVLEGTRSWSDAMRQILDSVARQLMQMATTEITTSITGGGGSSGGGWLGDALSIGGSIIGGLFSDGGSPSAGADTGMWYGAEGMSFSGSFKYGGITPRIPGAADGNVFNGPKTGYPVMMHGNEAVIPLKNGAVPVQMAGGGEQTNIFNINVTSGQGTGKSGGREDQVQLAKEIKHQMKLLVREELREQRRAGGLLNSPNLRTV